MVSRAAERLGKLHGGEPRAGDDQHAGRVAVEPVHQTRLLALLVAPGFQHVVDMADDARAALHGEAGRLVEDKDFRIFVDQHLGQNVAVVLVADGVAGERPVALLVHVERRDADHLARLDARVGLHPAAIDTDLAGAQQLLQMAEAKTRKMRLEPAVEPHARLAGLHLDLFYACHCLVFTRFERMT